MSEPHCSEVGFKKPPKKYRFSRENQPQRRRRKLPKSAGSRFLCSLIKTLDENVSFVANGKSKKLKLSEILAQKLVKQAVAGNSRDQFKLVRLLLTLGEFDPDTIRAEIEETIKEDYAQALAEARAPKDKLIADFFLAVDTVQQLRAIGSAIAEGFIGAKSKCSCGAYGGYPEADDALQKWYAEEDPDDDADYDLDQKFAHAQGWAPSVFGRAITQAPGEAGAQGEGPPLDEEVEVHSSIDGSEPDAPGGNLADGMIGND